MISGMKYWVFGWRYDIWNEPDIITPAQHPVLHSRYHNASQIPSTSFQISWRQPNTQYFIQDIITPVKHPVLHSKIPGIRGWD
jgi:hypothetical protein